MQSSLSEFCVGALLKNSTSLHVYYVQGTVNLRQLFSEGGKKERKSEKRQTCNLCKCDKTGPLYRKPIRMPMSALGQLSHNSWEQ
jgi:hypothetical protein